MKALTGHWAVLVQIDGAGTHLYVVARCWTRWTATATALEWQRMADLQGRHNRFTVGRI